MPLKNAQMQQQMMHMHKALYAAKQGEARCNTQLCSLANIGIVQLPMNRLCQHCYNNVRFLHHLQHTASDCGGLCHGQFRAGPWVIRMWEIAQ
jgi:hypothetical protein